MTGTGLEIWTVYDHPKDWPHGFIARKWVDGKPTNETICAAHLAEIYDQLEFMGFYRVPRDPSDDPVIIEVWL